VARGRAGDVQRRARLREADRGALPPVHLDDRPHAPAAQAGGHVQRHAEHRLVTAKERLDGRPVAVVVVVVREQHHVDGRQFVHLQCRRNQPGRPREGEGAGAVGKDGVGQDRHVGRLDQRRGVADPDDARCASLRAAAQGLHVGRAHRGRVVRLAADEATGGPREAVPDRSAALVMLLLQVLKAAGAVVPSVVPGERFDGEVHVRTDQRVRRQCGRKPRRGARSFFMIERARESMKARLLRR
jgi:hypothetical protein